MLSSKIVTAKQIKSKMEQCLIFNPNVQFTGMYSNIKYFINNFVNKTQSTKEEAYLYVISNIFIIQQKFFAVSWKQRWTKLFTIHAIIQNIGFKEEQNQPIYQLLIQQISKISKCQPIQRKNRQNYIKPQDFVKQSLSKLKKIFNTSVSQQKIKFQQQQNFLENGIVRSILATYTEYLRKIISDSSFFAYHKNIRLNSSRQFDLQSQNGKQLKKLSWKMFNIFQRINKIISNFSKLGIYFADLKKYIFSMINFLAVDIQVFYSPMIDYVQLVSSQFLLHYLRDIYPLKDLNKIQFRQKLLQLSKSQIFTELKVTMEEFGRLNQTVSYVYNGIFHRQFLKGVSIPTKYRSINQTSFERIFEIFDLIEDQIRRHYHQTRITNKRANQFAARLNSTMRAAKYKSSKLKQMEICEIKMNYQPSQVQKVTKSEQLTQQSVKSGKFIQIISK